MPAPRPHPDPRPEAEEEEGEPLRYAWYGDDFTGASDTLATLAEAGLRALLFLDVPTAAERRDAGPLDAVGIAGAARSMAPAQMREALAPVARFLAGSGARVLHYKCCSTFDSAPEVGSLGEAVRVLRPAAPDAPVVIVGGQPSLGRHCVFGQLFATSHDGEVHRIDRHPTMSRHPVTPMQEADLRRHLALQGMAPIGLVDVRRLEAAERDPRSAEAWMAALSQRREPDADAVLVDVLRDEDLRAVGRLIGALSRSAPVLCVGASSVAQAMLDHWELPRGRAPLAVAPAAGPVLALCGSLSPLSARQVAAATRYERIALDPAVALQADSQEQARLCARVHALLREGRHVLLHTTAAEPAAAAVPGRAPAHRSAADPALAPATGRLLQRLLREAPVARLAVAGGDTSSHALQALAPRALRWAGRVAPGVALCRLHAPGRRIDGLEVMLKGGQMGGEHLFETLVAGH